MREGVFKLSLLEDEGVAMKPRILFFSLGSGFLRGAEFVVSRGHFLEMYARFAALLWLALRKHGRASALDNLALSAYGESIHQAAKRLMKATTPEKIRERLKKLAAKLDPTMKAELLELIAEIEPRKVGKGSL